MPSAALFPLLTPLALVVIGALVALGFEPFLARSRKHALLPWLAAFALVGAALAQVEAPTGHLHALLAMDPVRSWLCLAIIGATLCSLASLQQSLARDTFAGGEPYSLAMFAAAGAMLMVMANDALAVFVALELMSLAIYALVGLRRGRRESNEALFKYFVMGSIFSAVFLYGAALVYGATGSTTFGHAAMAGHRHLFLIGETLMIIGMLFKVGAVPFHFWLADAYTGAPAAVTCFMGAVVKVAAFSVLGSLWLNLIEDCSGTGLGTNGAVLALGDLVTVTSTARQALMPFHNLFLALGLLSLVIGNFSALRQRSARRLIGFSAIANAGYMLLALALPAGEHVQLGSLWFFIIAYAIATAGGMAAVAQFAGIDDRGDGDQDLSGAARAQPFVGLVATLCVASIAGLPPTAGFLGKYLILADLVQKGKLMVALVAMLLAVVGAAYYLRFIIVLWSTPATAVGERERGRPPLLSQWTLAAAAVAVVVLLAWPDATTLPSFPGAAPAVSGRLDPAVPMTSGPLSAAAPAAFHAGP